MLPTSTFYRIMRGLHGTFATGVTCWQETLTPPDTWSHPIFDLQMFKSWDQSFFPNFSWFFRTICTSNILRYSIDFADLGECILSCLLNSSSSSINLSSKTVATLRQFWCELCRFSSQYKTVCMSFHKPYTRIIYACVSVWPEIL